MKRAFLILAAVGALATSAAVVEAAPPFVSGYVQVGGGYPYAAGYGNYGGYYGQPYVTNRPFVARFGGWGHSGHHGPRHTWHDTSHYDYHPGGYVRHYDHYDYVPGHWDYHQEGHWDHHHH